MSKWRSKEDWENEEDRSDYGDVYANRIGKLLFVGLVISLIIALCKLVEWLT
jgi:hypothetical protein